VLANEIENCVVGLVSHASNLKAEAAKSQYDAPA
jgi:hypothetical protein